MEDKGVTITDEQLREFVKWYRNHYEKSETFTAGMSISMAGYFHISTKQAKKLLERCNSIGLIKMRRENVTILIDGDPNW